MSVNHKIVYVPVGKDTRGVDLLYPIYLPIVVDHPDVVYATGKLSEEDYDETLKLYNLDDETAAGEIGGFPLAPLIAALAPIAIPPLITAAKKIFGRNKSSGTELSGAYAPANAGYIPTNPNIRNLKQLQALYEKYP